MAEEVTRHETGSSVVMNCTSYTDGRKTWLLAGQESHCQLYKINSSVTTLENGDIPGRSKENLRQRRRSERGEGANERVEHVTDNNSNIRRKKLQLDIKSMDSIQTDFGYIIQFSIQIMSFLITTLYYKRMYF